MRSYTRLNFDQLLCFNDVYPAITSSVALRSVDNKKKSLFNFFSVEIKFNVLSLFFAVNNWVAEVAQHRSVDAVLPDLQK